MAELPAVFKEKEHGTMGFTVLPDVDEDGTKIQYRVRMIKSELKKNKSSEGKNLSCQLKIQEGEKKGRLIFARFNLINKNPTAVQIANDEFADLCRACGKDAVTDSEELHGVDFFVELKINEETDTQPQSNSVSKYVAENDGKVGDKNPFEK